MLDKTIPTPLYYQLEQLIRRAIESGELKPGDPIPTEIELVEKYGVSRVTVRQALLQLVNEGYLRREKSKGTFVTKPPQTLLFLGSLKSFSIELDRKGIPHSTRVLDRAVMPAPARVADKLELPPGAEVWYVKRLRHVEHAPYLIDAHYVPYSLCPGINEKYRDDMSLYHLLETEYGINLHHGRIEFEAAGPATEEEAELLGVYPDTNLLYVQRVVCDPDDTPVNYFEAHIHGRFAIDMVSTGQYE